MRRFRANVLVFSLCVSAAASSGCRSETAETGNRESSVPDTNQYTGNNEPSQTESLSAMPATTLTAVDTSSLMAVPYDFEPEDAFPNLNFGHQRPIQLLSPPGDDGRVFVLCQEGKIHVFANDRDVGESHVFLDLGDRVSRGGNEEGLLGVAFHPDYATNGEFLVSYSADGPTSVISRFRVSETDADQADQNSEEVLLTVEQPFRTQNGGSIEFGPDGYLYIGFGDGGSSDDPQEHGQNRETLLGSILRIDVNKKAPGLNYSVPKDNPFVGEDNVRSEIWAYGFRNVWRLAFDHLTGRLWAGDVGQNRFEEIDIVTRGGNYGWNRMEGNHSFNFDSAWALPTMSESDLKAERDQFVKPALDYYHSEGRAIVGGRVYRGDRLPELDGAYLYADFFSGNVWALRHDGEQLQQDLKLCNSHLQVAGFGEDSAGEVYLCAFDGHIYRLKKIETNASEQRQFPTRLSETGLFSSTESMTPCSGVIPYSVNVPLWSDNAAKERYLALPAGGQIEFSDTGQWKFPEGAVVVKSFFMDTTEGDPETRLRLETRLLVKTTSGWEGYTYVWNEDQADARLIDASMTVPLDITTPEGMVHGNWYFPSRSDCQACHTKAAGFVLSVSTRQLNRTHQYPEGPRNQLSMLETLGVFTTALPDAPDKLDSYPLWEESSSTTEDMSRAYLDVNCAFCHSPGGPGNSPIDLRYHTPLEQASLVGQAPRGSRISKTPATAIVSPGRPQDSELIRRIDWRGPGQMPTLGTFVKDTKAVELISEWVQSLPPGVQK
ncbi:MAG: hypothetical protein GY903_02065 [Fuerstiella sp.]|nr:hypothetical protein [Fuerstiella sp.]MCP4853265.1 hypothetical protein [Fuerstiella sp.]